MVILTYWGSAASSDYAAHSAYLSGFPAYKALFIGAFAFLLISFVLDWLTRARHSWTQKLNDHPIVNDAVPAPPEAKEVQRLIGEIASLKLSLSQAVTDAEEARREKLAAVE